MDTLRRLCVRAALVLALFGPGGLVEAQISVSPTDKLNSSLGEELGVSNTPGSNTDYTRVYALAELTENAASSQDLNGNIIRANASSYLGIGADDIALISCDPGDYNGYYDANFVVNSVVSPENHTTAIVLYSTKQDYCAAGGFSSNDFRVYTMVSKAKAEDLLGLVSGNNAAYGTIASRGALEQQSQSGNASGTGSNQNDHDQNPLGPSPSTAVAMIILYSITGIITALFLGIIITGAIRAHRHPERYGPRNILGRPRQSRARGLARAMLETIPIVKFGDREAEQPTKTTDVELAEGEHGSVENLPHQPTGETASQQQKTPAAEVSPREGEQSTRATNEEGASGIAPAVHANQSATPDEIQGCSICTEDFELGQDQRVLPCDHRFHPACIDPWLLNVSGTCPLCRIDLRPQDARGDGDDHDPDDDPARAPDDAALAPPLETDATARMSIRRSILAGLTGGRPERMTREERLSALRQYRQQNSADPEPAATAGEESRVGRTLRNAFRIRTRRTGAGGDGQEQ